MPFSYISSSSRQEGWKLKFQGITFAVVGGDLRQKKLIEFLGKEGYRVKVFGFHNIKFGEKVEVCDSMAHALGDADIIIGPIPCSQDHKTLFSKYSDQPILLQDVFKHISKDKLFMAGRITEEIQRIANHYSFRVIDLLERDELAILNAIPTAEGAIQIAMENSEITIHGSKCLVLGFGRCGSVLAHMLKGIGGHVAVEARKPSDLAYIKAYGYTPIYLREMEQKIHEYDFIFNTVPSLVLDSQIMQSIKKESLIIDLASAPGGVDFTSAEQIGIKAMLCLSLPGKVAPETAALIIRDTIFTVYSEMGVIL